MVLRDLLCLISPLQSQCQGPAGKARAWAWPLQRALQSAEAAGAPLKSGEPDSELFNFRSSSVCPDVGSKTLPPAQSLVPLLVSWFVLQNWAPVLCPALPEARGHRPSRGSTRHLCKQWGLRRQKEAGVQGVLGCWGRLGVVTTALLPGYVLHEHYKQVLPYKNCVLL